MQQAFTNRSRLQRCSRQAVFATQGSGMYASPVHFLRVWASAWHQAGPNYPYGDTDPRLGMVSPIDHCQFGESK